LISLVYNSSAAVPFSEGDLLELLKRSRENNTAKAITGLLLFKREKFMQVLEGDESPVQDLLSRIEIDPRHHQVDTLRWEVIKERRFPDWSMGFRNLDNIGIHQTPGYSAFMNEPLTSPHFKADPSRVQTLIGMFRESP
jgi:hypothetical protein